MGWAALQVRVYRRLPPRLQVWATRLTTPNFTVGALGLVTDDGERLLLVRPTYRAGWLPPGGFLQRGESPVRALEREVVEELGIEMRFAEPHRVHIDPRRQAVTFVSVGILPAGAEPAVQGPELSDVRWFGLDALPPMPNDFVEGLPAEDLDAVRAAVDGAPVRER